jgi:hypothetical protein
MLNSTGYNGSSAAGTTVNTTDKLEPHNCTELSVLLQNLPVAHHPVISKHIEPEGSLPCSKEPTTGPCPDGLFRSGFPTKAPYTPI